MCVCGAAVGLLFRVLQHQRVQAKAINRDLKIELRKLQLRNKELRRDEMAITDSLNNAQTRLAQLKRRVARDLELWQSEIQDLEGWAKQKAKFETFVQKQVGWGSGGGGGALCVCGWVGWGAVCVWFCGGCCLCVWLGWGVLCVWLCWGVLCVLLCGALCVCVLLCVVRVFACDVVTDTMPPPSPQIDLQREIELEAQGDMAEDEEDVLKAKNAASMFGT